MKHASGLRGAINAVYAVLAAAGILSTGIAGSLLLGGCAVVKPYEREKLADPIMDPESPVRKQKLERKFQSTREGSAGGGTGAGGGCGCAK